VNIHDVIEMNAKNLVMMARAQHNDYEKRAEDGGFAFLRSFRNIPGVISQETVVLLILTSDIKDLMNILFWFHLH
jgi:hypothetical protein